MKWYNPTTWFVDEVEEKENPAQEVISWQEGSVLSSNASVNYTNAFDKLESVNRGVSMIVNACASLDYDVKEKLNSGTYPGLKLKTALSLLNARPNPYQPLQEFRKNIFTDFLLEGNAFIYYDGAYFYHLPAVNVEIIPDVKTFVNKYSYNNLTEFHPGEIAHFKDLSSVSIYRGTSRLKAADRNIKILYKMQDFQENFFDNGAVFNLAITTDNTLSQIAKDKTIQNWMKQYSPKAGGKKPVILDSGLKPIQLAGANSFREMDFDTSIKTHNVKILETLGVPPVLLDGGNQANIAPNLRLFYLETVMPIIRAYISAMELLTGYDIDAIVSNVNALQPDIKDIAVYNTTLVNGGILTPNEARIELRYEKDKDPESDKLRVPANIAGSAADASQGGAPKKPAEAPKPAPKVQ
ncbi:MAG: Phage portal protein [Parcubacteria group bacterium ADurb.Bin216]|nr:MAG: Phage portal protein [Parcubacteria group bacterium ADurb.Bin216]